MTKVSTEGVGGGTRGYKSRAVTKNKRKKNKNVKPKLVHLINWIQKLGSEKKRHTLTIDNYLLNNLPKVLTEGAILNPKVKTRVLVMIVCQIRTKTKIELYTAEGEQLRPIIPAFGFGSLKAAHSLRYSRRTGSTARISIHLEADFQKRKKSSQKRRNW